MTVTSECQSKFSTELTAWNPETASDGGVTWRFSTLLSGWAAEDPVVVYWRADDLTSFPSSYATSLARVIGVDLPPPTSTPASPSSISTLPTATGPVITTGSPGLNTGAAAAVGVGVAFGSILLMTIVACIFWRRRNRKQPNTEHPDFPETEAEQTLWKRFFGGKWRAEMQAPVVAQEVDSRAVRIIPGPPAELDAAGKEESRRDIGQTEHGTNRNGGLRRRNSL